MVMVLDSGEVFMDQVDGENTRDSLERDVRPDPTKTDRPQAKRSSATKREKVSQNGMPSLTGGGQGVERRARAPLHRPLSMEVTPQRLRGSQEVADRRVQQPPWRSGSAAPSPPTRSLTSPSLKAGGWMRRSESTCSVNYPLGLRAGRGQMRPATSLPHIAKGSVGSALSSPPRPCLLVALRPLNLEQEKQTFFQSDYKYEPQFEYAQPEPRSVLDKYREGSGLFLEQVGKDLTFNPCLRVQLMIVFVSDCPQAVGIMECVLRKFGTYENFEEVTGGNVLPKSQVWAAVRKYLQKEGCVGEVSSAR